jgi:DNA-directed RNA polymerase subunit RPC12/RpoP
VLTPVHPINAPAGGVVPGLLAHRTATTHVKNMASATPGMTFGELAHAGLEIEVTCPNCNHRRLIDGNAPRLRDRPIAGARFRCEKCGSVGLPELGKQRLWTQRLAKHARNLK